MNSSIRLVAPLLILLLSGGCGGSSSGTTAPPPPSPPPGLGVGPDSCVGGMAGDFACSGIDLRRRVPNVEMGGGDGNDIWGWVDPMNGDEYAIMGLTNGTAFVDISDPENPVVIGHLAASNMTESAWRDMKVYMDHAYIVTDGAGAHGMQIFDLKRLRNAVPPDDFMPDAVYMGFGNAHNIAINEDTGYAYAVGTNTCNEGLHIVDIMAPTMPVMAGCYDQADIHDTQCVVYLGPDPDHAGNPEICFSSSRNPGSNAPQLDITDVTDKMAPANISTRNYPQAGFAHQGWLTGDHRFFLLGDEADETGFSVPTRTHVFDVSDLDAPVYVYAYEAATVSIDHNLYILGNRVYQANYTSGVRVLEFADLSNMDLMQVRFFDTYPASDAVGFEGLWSVYPFFPSGNIIASDRANGLFILTVQ